MALANSISMVPFSSPITILLFMLLMHSGTVSVAMESSTGSTNSTAIVLESRDQTTSCTMCDECPNPCPVPSSPPPLPPVVECPPPPSPSPPPPSPSPLPPVLPECPPPPSPPPPALPECPPPPSPPPPALPECPPPPPPASPCQDTCLQSPPGPDVPALVPNRPPITISPPSVNPVYYYYPPPPPGFSKSVDLKMQYSTTVTFIFVFFSTRFLIISFY